MFFNSKKNHEIGIELSKISTTLEKLIEIENTKSIQQEKKEKSNINSNIEVMIKRFYKLFELHNIFPSEIPQVIDKKFNISIHDVASNDNLLKIINIELLEWLADFFGICLNWLLDRTDILYEEQNFDKFEMSFFRLINSLSKENSFVMDLIRTCELKKNDSNKQEQLIYPVIRVALIKLNNRTIYKNILINKYIWDYRRSRLDFKTIVYMLYYGYVDYYKQRIHINGYNKNKKTSHYDFIKGLIKYDDLKDIGGMQTWYPSDFIENNTHISLENEELELVLNQIQEKNLINSCEKYLDFWNKQQMENDNIKNYDNAIANENKNPIIIYTEGKTDIMHIENAWKILFEKEHNFKFISFDGIEKLANHISSSNGMLEKQITNNKIIAIFDSDSTGIKNFKKLTTKDPNEKYALAKNSNRTFIVLLPFIEPDLNGLCEIEFLYPRHILEKYEMLEERKDLNEIMKLSDNPKTALEILQKFDDNEKVEKLKYYKIIEGKKNKFAQEIQSDINLKKEDLEVFEDLFNLINKISEEKVQ